MKEGVGEERQRVSKWVVARRGKGITGEDRGIEEFMEWVFANEGGVYKEEGKVKRVGVGHREGKDDMHNEYILLILWGDTRWCDIA